MCDKNPKMAYYLETFSKKTNPNVHPIHEYRVLELVNNFFLLSILEKADFWKLILYGIITFITFSNVIYLPK